MSTQSQERMKRLETLPFERIGRAESSAMTGFLAAVADAWRHRELLDLLVRRELKARYKDSSLGFLWSLIRPLVLLGIYYFAIGKILGAERGIPSFAIFVFAGLTLWGLFSEVITGCTQSILANAGLIKKIYLPREIFPLAATGSAIFNFVIQLVVLILATVVLRQVPWHADLLHAPLAIVVIVIYGVAFGLVLAAVNVFMRDVQYLVEVGLLIGFWLSPIVYSFGFVVDAIQKGGLPSWITEIYLINPFSLAVLAFQKAFWIAGETPAANALYPDFLALRLVVMGLIGLVIVWISQRIFTRLQGNFAQEI